MCGDRSQASTSNMFKLTITFAKAQALLNTFFGGNRKVGFALLEICVNFKLGRFATLDCCRFTANA